MKIALLGYGKMGREVEEIAVQRGHQISLRAGRAEMKARTDGILLNSDIAIEFSIPEAVSKNIHFCFDSGIAIVVGSTGWYQSFEEIEKRCRLEGHSLFYATNFSIGVNLFWKIAEQMTKIMKMNPEYTPRIGETHHIHKKDMPSGTAISTAEVIIKNDHRWLGWELGLGTNQKIGIDVQRTGETHGYHEIKYSSETDEISLHHNALSRKGFALGAVLAAEFLHGKKGIFTMNDLLK